MSMQMSVHMPMRMSTHMSSTIDTGLQHLGVLLSDAELALLAQDLENDDGTVSLAEFGRQLTLSNKLALSSGFMTESSPNIDRHRYRRRSLPELSSLFKRETASLGKTESPDPRMVAVRRRASSSVARIDEQQIHNEAGWDGEVRPEPRRPASVPQLNLGVVAALDSGTVQLARPMAGAASLQRPSAGDTVQSRGSPEVRISAGRSTNDEADQVHFFC